MQKKLKQEHILVCLIASALFVVVFIFIAHVSTENALRADWIANSLLDEIVHDLIVVELDSQKEESVRLLLEKEKENLRLPSEKKDEEIGLLVDRIRAPRKVVKLLFLIYLTCILPMFWWIIG